MTSTARPQSPAPAGRSAVLVRQSALGEFWDPAPRPELFPDPVLRWGRPVLQPMSSAMRVATHHRVVSFTYDDGPDPERTPGVLDALAAHGARATFFLLSDNAEAHPEIVRRMVAEGHEVAVHGIDHARLTEVGGLEAVRRVREARRRIERVAGVRTRWYRPTYGAIDPVTLAGARLSGLDVVIWTAWAQDWEEAPAEEIAGRALTALHPGAILLLHDTTDDPEARAAGPLPTFSRAEVTRRILEGMSADGYRSVTVGELFGSYPQVRALTVQRPRLPGR